jgi:hypothetical protein
MVDELFGCCTGGEIRGFRVFVVVVLVVLVVLLLWRRCECFKCRVPGFWMF